MSKKINLMDHVRTKPRDFRLRNIQAILFFMSFMVVCPIEIQAALIRRKDVTIAR